MRILPTVRYSHLDWALRDLGNDHRGKRQTSGPTKKWTSSKSLFTTWHLYVPIQCPLIIVSICSDPGSKNLCIFWVFSLVQYTVIW